MTVITNFLKAPFPEPQELAGKDLDSPDRFQNRELSWLAFNWRVLEEAENTRVPLLGRSKVCITRSVAVSIIVMLPDWFTT